MKKLIFAALSTALCIETGAFAALAGTWQQDMSRPVNAGGVTNWQWRNDDGSLLKGRWAWIDGNGDGLAECYYFYADGYMAGATAVTDSSGTYTVNADGAWTEDGAVRVYPDQWVPGGNVLTSDNAAVSAVQGELNPIGSGYSDADADHSALTDAEAYDILMQIKAEYPEGTSWGDDRQYVSGRRYGYGCAAFVFMVQDRLYGAPAKPHTINTLDIRTLRVGDHIRLAGNTHSVIVLKNNGDSINVAEGNYNGRVHWGRLITAAELQREFVYAESCY